MAGTGANDEEAFFFPQVDEKEKGGGGEGHSDGNKSRADGRRLLPCGKGGWGKYVTRPTEGLHTAP